MKINHTGLLKKEKKNEFAQKLFCPVNGCHCPGNIVVRMRTASKEYGDGHTPGVRALTSTLLASSLFPIWPLIFGLENQHGSLEVM